MKKLILILAISVLIVGCSLKKKVVSSSASVETKSVVETKFSDNLKSAVDTSKSDELEVTYSKIEYYPPAESVISKDTASAITPAPAPPAVKSIETYTVRKKKESKGETKIEKNTEQAVIRKDTTHIAQQNFESQQPAPDPRRWRYIFGILLLCAGALIYFKRSKVFPWLKAVLSRARNMLKI